MSWQAHSREVFAVHWNLIEKSTFVTSSWDGTVKIVQAPHPHQLAPHQLTPPGVPSGPPHTPTPS